MLTEWLGRYWRIALIGSLVLFGSAIWITVTSEHPISMFIIRFLATWSPAFTATAVVILTIATFTEVRESHRVRSASRKEWVLNGLHNWAFAAKASILLLDIREEETTNEMNVAAKLTNLLTQGTSFISYDGHLSAELQQAITNALTCLRQSIVTFRNGNNVETLASVLKDVSDSLTKVMVLGSLERSKI